MNGISQQEGLKTFDIATLLKCGLFGNSVLEI